MDPVHEQDRIAAIAICCAFIRRLITLDDAIIGCLDDTDDGDDTTAALPQYFSTNDAHRKTYLFVAAHEFSIRSLKHLTILFQYKEILGTSLYRDFRRLSALGDPGLSAAVGRWRSWEAVEASWPFDVPVETLPGEEVVRVCHEMWTALRAVAVAALDEESRVGPCEFHVAAAGGVVGLLRTGNVGARGSGGFMGYLKSVFRDGGKLIKQD